MSRIEINDPHSRIAETYEGELIAHVDSREPNDTPRLPKDRWVTIDLYGLSDGMFLIHRAGCSRVYHRGDGKCITPSGRPSGDEATVDDLPDDAVPCERCRPPFPEDLADDQVIRYEFARPTLDRCPTVKEVITRLTVARKRGSRQETTVVSEPVRELLNKAARADRRFAEPHGQEAVRTA